MGKSAMRIAAALACLLVLCLAYPALALEKEITHGDPAWVLNKLNADKVTISLTNLSPSSYTMCKVEVLYNDEVAQASATRLVNISGTQTETLTYNKIGDNKIASVSISCLKGKAKAVVECVGGGF